MPFNFKTFLIIKLPPVAPNSRCYVSRKSFWGKEGQSALMLSTEDKMSYSIPPSLAHVTCWALVLCSSLHDDRTFPLA